MNDNDPIDPTSLWNLESRSAVASWRASAIRACLHSITVEHRSLDACLTSVDRVIRQHTGQGLDKVAGQWRQKALERCRPAYERRNWEAAATELVYYIEEVVCINRRQLQDG